MTHSNQVHAEYLFKICLCGMESSGIAYNLLLLHASNTCIYELQWQCRLEKLLLSIIFVRPWLVSNPRCFVVSVYNWIILIVVWNIFPSKLMQCTWSVSLAPFFFLKFCFYMTLLYFQSPLEALTLQMAPRRIPRHGRVRRLFSQWPPMRFEPICSWVSVMRNWTG